ncbi:hypothetical protein HMPREF9619_00485 [Cutibacterium acnes HL082PA2]|nr:hypothetical protein HMPREF9619_00485 [Cutibacterium acnes HL082PA2]
MLMSLLTLAAITPLVLIDHRHRPDDTRYRPDRDLHKFAVAAN